MLPTGALVVDETAMPMRSDRNPRCKSYALPTFTSKPHGPKSHPKPRSTPPTVKLGTLKPQTLTLQLWCQRHHDHEEDAQRPSGESRGAGKLNPAWGLCLRPCTGSEFGFRVDGVPALGVHGFTIRG